MGAKIITDYVGCPTAVEMEDKYKWTPWIDFKPELDDPDRLPISGPPCVHCEFWLPRRKYVSVPSLREYRRLQFDGIVCCHSGDMEHDFSCFKTIEVVK